MPEIKELGFKYYFCTDCSVIHYKEGGGRCRDCYRIYAREYQRNKRATDAVFAHKEHARSRANYAQRRGRLKKQSCQWCGAAKAQKHHEDYLKPLNVEWMCGPCHHKFHKKHRVAEKIMHLCRAIAAAS